MTPNPAPDATRTGPGGSIYDLGYQRYSGVRLGRRHAVRALFSYSLRGAFGIGRSGRAKIAPFALAFLALLPALIAVGISALINQAAVGGRIEQPIRLLGTYLALQRDPADPVLCSPGPGARRARPALHGPAAVLLAGHAPQRLRAREAGGPVGRTRARLPGAAAADLRGSGPVGARHRRPPWPTTSRSLVPVVEVAALTAFVLGRISLGAGLLHAAPRLRNGRDHRRVPHPAASWPRSSRSCRPGRWRRIAALLDPPDLLDGANAFLFGGTPSNDVLRASGLPSAACVVALLAWGIVSVAATLRRYARIPA